MTNLQIMSLIGLIPYFGLLLFAVTKEKKNTNVLDYFFCRKKPAILGFVHNLYRFMVGSGFGYFHR